MLHVLLLHCGFVVLGSPVEGVRIDPADRERLEQVRQGVAAWLDELTTYDIRYVARRHYTPAAQKMPTYRTITRDVHTTSEHRVLRAGAKRRAIRQGEGLHVETLTKPRIDSDSVFDGRDTYSRNHRYGSIVRGADDVPLLEGPMTLVPMRRLHEIFIAADRRTRNIVEVTCEASREDRWIVTFHLRSMGADGEIRTQQFVYVVNPRQRFVIVEYAHRFDDRPVTETVDIRYEEIGGMPFPVEATYLDRIGSTGEVYRKVHYRVSVEDSVINPPDGLPDELFELDLTGLEDVFEREAEIQEEPA